MWVNWRKRRTTKQDASVGNGTRSGEPWIGGDDCVVSNKNLDIALLMVHLLKAQSKGHGIAEANELRMKKMHSWLRMLLFKRNWLKIMVKLMIGYSCHEVFSPSASIYIFPTFPSCVFHLCGHCLGCLYYINLYVLNEIFSAITLVYILLRFILVKFNFFSCFH